MGISVSSILALIIATLVLQAAAGVVGLSLGIHPLLVLTILTFIALASMLGILELSDLFAEQSTKIQSWIQRIEAKTRDLSNIRTYGAMTLTPSSGFRESRSMGHRSWHGSSGGRGISIFYMLTGWIIASALVMGTALGLVNLIVE